MLINVLDILQKAGVVLTASLALISAAFMQPKTIVVIPLPSPTLIYGDSALAYAYAGPASTTAATSATASSSSEESLQIISGLLPVVELPPAASAAKTEMPTPPPASPELQRGESVPKTVTGRWLLDNSKLTLNQKIDSSYWPSFSVNLGGSKNFNWDLSAASIGGSGTVPQFNVSFSCNPIPTEPAPGSSDQNPSFDVRTSYSCVVSLTDSASRKYDRQFDFQTGPGRLVIKISNMSTLLKYGLNTNAFVFDNQDSQPITLTGLVFDASFTALSTSSSPLVIRFVDPKNEATLYEYHMENLPPDLSRPYTYGQTNIQVNFPFEIGAAGEKAIFVEALGVSGAVLTNANPEIRVALKNISTDRNDIKTIFISPIISWSCIPMQYNPYATSTDTSRNCSE